MPRNLTFAPTAQKDCFERIFINKSPKDDAEQLKILTQSEEQRKDDYSGRVILELIQNIDDAAVGHKNAQAKFILTNNKLHILNQGTPFTEDTLNKLRKGGLSTKENNNETTGSKGIGFRSLLNWSNDIRIYSDIFAIQFARDLCLTEFEIQLNKYPKTKEQADIQQLQSNPPIIALPFNASTYPDEWDQTTNTYIDTNGTIYDTCIELIIQPEKYDLIRDSIENFLNNHTNTIIFSRAIKQINFIYTDKNNIPQNNTISLHTNTDKHLKVLSTDNGHEEFYFFSATTQISNDKKSTESIAVSKDWLPNTSHPLYCTFPITNAKCPFPIIMNSTGFKLTSNRDALAANNTDNINALNRLCDLLINTVIPFFTKPDFNTRAIEILHHTTEDFIETFKHYDIKDFYDKVAKLNIIPTMDGTFSSLDNALHALPANTPEYIISDCKDFATSDAYNALSYSPTLQNKITIANDNIIYDLINERSNTWDTKQRIETFYFWRNFTKDHTLKKLPKLLKNTDNDFWYISQYYSKDAPNKIMLDTDKGIDISDVPWYNQQQLHQDDKAELHKQFIRISDKDTLNRQISTKHSDIFIDGDKSRIAETLNNNINNDYNRAVSFVRFLYKNYLPLDNKARQSANENIWNLPTKEKTVSTSKNIYFGPDYSQNIEETEICRLAELDELAPFNEIVNTEGITSNDFMDLMQAFGVISDIKPERHIIQNCSQNYTQIAFDKLNSTQNIPNLRHINSIELSHIPRLDTVLKNVSQSHKNITTILAWINKLYKGNNLPNTQLATINYTYLTRAQNTQYNVELPNYTLHKLRTTKWLKTNNTNTPVSPEECRIRPIKKEGHLECPDALMPYTPETQTPYTEIWKIIGAKENIAQLPANIFYTILLKMHNYDPAYSKTLYNYIAKNSVPHLINTPATDPVKQQFIQNGQLLASKRTNTKLTFYPVADVQVKAGTNSCANLQDIALIHKPQRDGTAENFASIFGIKKFHETIKLSVDLCKTHSQNEEFQKYFEDFRPYLMAFNATEKLHQASSHIKFILKESLYQADGTRLADDIPDYFCICVSSNPRTYFIKLSADANIDKQTLADTIAKECNTISASEDITSDINLLYINSNEHRQKQLEDKGYILVTNQDTKQRFISAIKQLSPTTEPDIIIPASLNFDNFASDENIIHIINILNTLNATVDDFESYGFYDIDLTRHNANKLETYIQDNTDTFKTWIYNKLLQTNNPEQQKHLEQRFYDFANLTHTCKIPNKHNFDAKQFIASEYPELAIGDITNMPAFSYSTYEKNKKELEKRISDPEILESNYNKSLLHFGHIELIISRFNSAKAIPNAQHHNTTASDTDINITISTVDISAIPTNTNTHNDNNTKRKPNKTGEQYAETTNKSKQINGARAEEIVYKKLCEQYRNTNVLWLSGNAKNITAKEQIDDTLGYDIKFKDNNGNWNLVEVKSATRIGNNKYLFKMSSNEIKTEHESNLPYHVYAVTHDANEYKIHILSGQSLKKAIKNGQHDVLNCTFNI